MDTETTSRKLASLQVVRELTPIEGADSIELAHVLGWQCVVKKGEFKAGDVGVFFEIDSLLPDRPQFEFMRSAHFRVLTRRFRGALSQGLLLPLEDCYNGPVFGTGPNTTIGTDITEYIGVTKYEPPVPVNRGEIRGGWPTARIPKTDEIRIQSAPELLDKLRGQPYYITEKLDGTSATYCVVDGEFHACSRNLSMKRSEGSFYWNVPGIEHIEKYLLKYPGIYIQGEIVGPGIQGNPLKLNQRKLFVFNIGDQNEDTVFGYDEMFGKRSLWLGVQIVPVVIMSDKFDHTQEWLLEKAKMPTLLPPSLPRVPAEGIVVRSEHTNRAERISFKVLNNALLENEAHRDNGPRRGKEKPE